MSNPINWLAGLLLATCAFGVLVAIGLSGRPLNARALHRPWVLNLVEEVRLALAFLADAVFNPPSEHPDSGLSIVLGERDPHRLVPHRLVIDDPDDDNVEAGEEESPDELVPEPMTEPGSDVETKELPVLYYGLGPLPRFDEELLHSGMTGAFPALSAAVLAEMAAAR
jgi:hypothetical protein